VSNLSLFKLVSPAKKTIVEKKGKDEDSFGWVGPTGSECIVVDVDNDCNDVMSRECVCDRRVSSDARRVAAR